MKKSLKNVVCLLALVAMTAPSFASIASSAHDFSADTWSANSFCEPCHTPHSAGTEQDGAPLWSHVLTIAGNITPYTSVAGTMQATTGIPSGTSLLCLSCHDGTLELDAYKGSTGTTLIGVVSAAADLGTDLSSSHPISFTYDDTLAGLDGSLHTPSTTTSGLGGFIAADMLFGGQMECASCHDVHNAANLPSLLIKTNVGSALCITCHDK